MAAVMMRARVSSPRVYPPVTEWRCLTTVDIGVPPSSYQLRNIHVDKYIPNGILIPIGIDWNRPWMTRCAIDKWIRCEVTDPKRYFPEHQSEGKNSRACSRRNRGDGE